jgi:zinc-binding alcohol dehydrogenase family protein
MKAIGYKTSLPITDSDALCDIEIEKPVASGRDILVEVKAISVNPVDTKIRRNVEPSDGKHKILGWDVSGVVIAVGGQASLFKVGDEVWYAGAINRPGANSEYHLVDERIASKKPISLMHEQAAALPLTSITAWELLFDRLKITEDNSKKLLVIGAAGGVGSVLIQLAKQLTQLTVIATASRNETKEWVRSLGADHVIDHSKPLSDGISSLGIPSVEYVISLNQTKVHATEIEKVLAPQGQLALIDDPGIFDIMPFKTKSIAIHWELMFTRSLFETEDMIEQHRLLERLSKLVDDGVVKTTAVKSIGTINAKNLKQAHSLLESGQSIGKIVLSGF